MNRPATAREALIVEALSDVALLLDRVESLTSSMEASRIALAQANAALGDRLKAFEAEMMSITHQTKAKAVEHIVRRAGDAARLSIDAQGRAMNEAARLAFSTQVDSNLARLAATLQQAIHRVDQPWSAWLTHAATAVVSATLPWFVAASFGFK
jgi:acyl-homoserine lactone acylase PvdQ